MNTEQDATQTIVVPHMVPDPRNRGNMLQVDGCYEVIAARWAGNPVHRVGNLVRLVGALPPAVVVNSHGHLPAYVVTDRDLEDWNAKDTTGDVGRPDQAAAAERATRPMRPPARERAAAVRVDGALADG